MSINKKFSRRNWLRGTATAALGLTVFKRVLTPTFAYAEDKVTKESDPIAVGFKYCENSGSATCAVKDKGKDGVCKNCQYFNKDGKAKKIDGKAMGTCLMMQGAYVSESGTCSMFAKK